MTSFLFWLMTLAGFALLCGSQKNLKSTTQLAFLQRHAVAMRMIASVLILIAIVGLVANHAGHLGIVHWLGALPLITVMLSLITAPLRQQKQRTASKQKICKA